LKVFYTAAARLDLIEIGAWIALDNITRAEIYIAELQGACEALGNMPRAFSVVSRRRKVQVRRKPYDDYLIFYRIKRSTVEILHVVHGALDYEAILFPERIIPPPA
jgi:plasmid stabilization system protein ParE